MISCPNLSNKQVAQQFQELVDVVGEVAAYDIWSQNEGNAIDRAPNGAPSKLFSDLLEHFNGDRVAAIQAKAKVFSESFKTWFGDWLSTENDIQPGEIIFGHPAIGKTYSFEQGKYKDKFIDWDVEYNQKRDKWIEDHSNTKLGTPEYKKARNEYLIYPENHPDYVEFITDEWERVKAKAKNEGKILFASPHTLLKFFPQDFTRIINLEKTDFIKRNTDRGGKNKEGAMWKEGIDETIANTKNIPITTLSEGEYFEDYLNKAFNNVSKVVDENGEPKILYHTVSPSYDASFDIFNTTDEKGNPTMIYFTDDLDMSKSYARNHRAFKTLEYVKKRLSEIPAEIIKRNEYVTSNLNKLTSDETYIKELGYTGFEDQSLLDLIDYYKKSQVDYTESRAKEKAELEAIIENPKSIEYIKLGFLNFKNPLIIDGRGNWWNELSLNQEDDIVEMAKHNNLVNETIEDRIREEAEKKLKGNPSLEVLPYDELLGDDEIEKIRNEVTEEVLKELGDLYKFESTRTIEEYARNIEQYDGVIFENIRDYGAGGIKFGNDFTANTVYAAKNPNQIKSAVDNTGEFSKEDPNIFHDVESEVGDRTTDKTIKDRLFNGQESSTVKDVLTAIDGSNSELSELVSMINAYTNGFIDDITVKLTTKDSRYSALSAAIYDNATGEILINPDAVSKYDDNRLDRVILHEIIHAFTTNVLKTNADKRAEAEAILASTRKLLAKKYNTTWEQLSKDKAYSMYGLTNINEFFSELFANPRFIKELQDISGARILSNVRNNTIFGKIINWIASLFGIEPGLYGKSRSLLESIMNESTGLSKVNAEIAPNGKESILFKSLLGITKGNWHEAIQLKTKLLTQEFRNWFGDWTNSNDPNVSKVVDENGEPLLVWHGGVGGIKEFKPGYKHGETGIYFTSSTDYAGWFYIMYDEAADMNNIDIEDGRKTGDLMPRGDMYPVFLNMRTPNRYTEELHFTELSRNPMEHDGIIADKVIDGDRVEDHYIVFESNQIKSVFNNKQYSTSGNIYESILSIPDSKNDSEVFPYLDGDDTSSDTTDVDPERGAFMQLVYDPSNTGSMLPGYQSSKDLSDALKSDKFLSECDFEYTVSEYGKRYSIDDPSTWDDAAIYLHLYHKSGKKYVMALRTPSSYSRTFNYKTNDVLEFELGKLSAFRNSIIEASKKGRVMPAVINRTNGTLNTLRNGSKAIQRPIQEVPIFKIPSNFDMTSKLQQFALGKGIAGDYKAFTVFGEPVDITAGSGTSYFTIPAEDTPNKKKPVSVKVNVKRFSKSAKGTVELILKLLADYKANEVDYVTIDGKELPITPMDLLSLIINFGMQTKVDKNAMYPKEILRYEILKDKQLYMVGDQLYIGEEVFNISDLTSDKAGTEAYKKAYDIISNMHYSIEKTNIWSKLNKQPELKRLQDWMARRNLDKIDIIPGELSISKEDFELTHLGWLIKNKTIFSDLADQAFSNPYIYAEGVVSKPDKSPQQQKQPEPQQPTTSTGTSSQTQRARTEAALKKILTLYKHLIDGLSSRIDTVNRYNTKNLEQINNMQRLLRQLQYDKLIDQLTELEQQEGIIRFVSYLMTDIDNATKYIDNALANPNTVNSTQLNQLNTDYIGFYKPMLEEVKRLLDTTNWFEGQGFVVDDETITKKELQNYVNSLIVEFTEIGNKYDSLVEIVSANIIKAWGEDTGSTTLKETISELTATDKDILYIARYMGMSSQLNDEAIRLIHLTITNAKNEVARSTNRKGQKLVNLSEQLPDKKLLQLLYEKDKDGKFTGYLVRDLNYGQHNADKRRAFDKINAEFGIEKDIDAGKLPEDRRKEYRRRIHEWHSKYSERRFIPDYYEAGLALSDATVLAKDELQTEMNIIMSKGRDKNGTFNPSLLTKAQRNKLRGLVKQKANLSNLYYLDGSPKTGTDLQIALELKTFNDKIDGNLKYTVNQDAFEAEMAKMQATLTKEQFEIWQEFNTRTVYDEAFYKKLDEIERSWYGERYEALRKERNELLRLTRDINEAYTDETLFSNSYLERIKDIDVEMNDIRRNTPTDKKEGLKFSDIAEIVRKPEWAEGLKEALKTNDTKWLSLNTMTDPKSGEILPTSAWTYIKPKNSNYIRIEPNRFWSELSPESNWINENYDTADSAEYIQPKRKFYDNRIAYNKAQSNATLKKIYEELINTTDESNRKVSFLSNSSRYKIPQISARMMEMSKRQGDFKESLKFMAEDTLGVNNDDTDFINEFAKRPDGSYIKFVPTHFIDMLKDPNMITSDLIGAYIAYHEMAENYKQMNSIAPDIELVIHQLGKRKVTKKVGVKGKTETIEGQLSNVFFKAINLADMEVYGKRKDNVEVKLPNSKTRISITKVLTNFAEYVRRVNLFANLPAIFTGFTTAATYSSIESILGRYYTVKGLNDANKTVLSKLPEVMANLGNPAHKDLLGAMLMYNQVTRSNRDTYKYLDQSKTLRALNKHFWYNGYSAGDFIVKSTMLVAIYKDHKLYNGEFISRSQFISRYYPENKSEGNKIWSRMGDTLYDAYTFDSDGILTPKKEYAEYINTKLENKIKNLSNHLAADLDGVLNDSDRAYVHQNAYLQLLFLHRNFMIIGAHKRFKSRQFNHMTQFEEEGMYITPVRFLFDFFKSGNITNLKALVQMYNDAEPYEQYNIKRTILELGSIAALAIIVVPLLNALADEDPDNWFTNEMAYVALRTRFELSTMYNPLELINMLNSPSAATGTIEQLSGIIKILMIPNWFGDKSAFSDVKSGPYEGMPKFMKNMIKSTPVKNLFEVRDPRAKRKYMETQLTF